MASECGLTLTKYIFYVYQFLLLLTGLAICFLGAWNFMITYHFLQVLDNYTYTTAFYLFIATGCLVIFIFSLGCCAVPKHWTILLFCVIILLVATVLFELLIGILVFLYQENIEVDLNLNFNKTILNTYKFDDSKTASIDYIQEKLHCCGAYNYEDWESSLWILNKTAPNKVPDSCCKTVSEGCGVRNHPSNIYLEGCIEFIFEKISSNCWLIFIAALAVCVFHAMGVILGVILYLKLETLKFNDDYSPHNGGTEALLSDTQQHL